MFAIIGNKMVYFANTRRVCFNSEKTGLGNRALFNRYYTISYFDEYNRFKVFSFNCTEMTAMTYNIKLPISFGLRFSDVWLMGHESVVCKTNRRSH